MIILDLFDEFHFRNDKGAKTEDKCCKNQDFIKTLLDERFISASLQ